MKITIETTISAPVEKIWQAWTTPEDIKQWNVASEDWHCPNAEIDLKSGGHFSYRMEARDGSMSFDFSGKFGKVVTNEIIEFSLEDERSVVVEFIAGNEGVTVRETFEAEEANEGEQQRQGWQSILNNFARHVAAKSSR